MSTFCRLNQGLRQPVVSRRTCGAPQSASASASAHRATRSPICEETRPVGCAAAPRWEEGPAGTRAAALTLCLALNATCADVAQAEGVVQRDVETVKKEALLQMTGIYAALFAITGAGAAYSAIKGETAGTAPSVKVKAVKGASRKSAQKKKSNNSATAQKRFGLF